MANFVSKRKSLPSFWAIAIDIYRWPNLFADADCYSIGFERKTPVSQLTIAIR
jgi:hypothetical protein